MSIEIYLDRILVEKKMQLSQLADEVGVSIVNLSNIKTGKIKAIRFSTLNAMCKVLKCQPGDILKYIDDDIEIID